MRKDKSVYWLAALGCLVIVPLALWLWALVFMQLWSWFVMPLGMAPLSMELALGLNVTVALLIFQHTPDYEGKTLEQILAALIGLVVVRPLGALLMGWLIRAVL